MNWWDLGWLLKEPLPNERRIDILREWLLRDREGFLLYVLRLEERATIRYFRGDDRCV
jgi:hypothetical protein